MKYKRVLLKLSGEALSSKGKTIDNSILEDIANQISELADMGVELSIVVGGGNIFRGVHAAESGIERVTADYMGMLATIINALALQNAIEKAGVVTRLLSSIAVKSVAEPFIRRRAIRHLEKGRVVLFAGGTGNPYFSTDTAAVLRAVEIGAQVLLKATKVDGIYDSDPVGNPDAKKFEQISYLDVINKNLKVMDMTAITMCQENNLPIIVFNLFTKGNIKRAVEGEKIGTFVGNFE